MMTIYIDSESKCHVTNDGTMKPFETAHFDGKCNEFIEGHRCVINEVGGIMIAPWKDIDELDKAQREYEKQLLAEYAEALKVLGVIV